MNYELTEEEIISLIKELEEDGEIRKDENGRYHVTQKGLRNYGSEDN